MGKTEAIANCTDEGFKPLSMAICASTPLCLPAGHYRVEEGSEHYLFYELEERLERPFIHGWIVGLGVHLLSRLQGYQHEQAVAFMKGGRSAASAK